MERYLSLKGLIRERLVETNFMIFDTKNSRVAELQRLWWNEINSYSRRCQLSVNYALKVAGVTWHPLLGERKSVRDANQFAMFGHRLHERAGSQGIYAAWYRPGGQDNLLVPPEGRQSAASSTALDLDVVVCVHNALDEVTACLASLETALRGRGKLIVVDDASDDLTAQYLGDFAIRTRAVVIRNVKRVGYTKAANAGIRATGAGRVLLLNSDTIVPPRALDKLVETLDQNPLLGLVGPLSNAASFQSVPSTAGSKDQTAINALPHGMTVAEVDAFFEREWNGLIPRTPLVHGFCLCIRREVFEKIGLFDEVSFPDGYGEENDFCFRAVDAGFDLGIATNTYIFHAKSKSYSSSERQKLMTAGMQALIRKANRGRVARSVETMKQNPYLEAVRRLSLSLFEETTRVRFQAPGLRTAS